MGPSVVAFGEVQSSIICFRAACGTQEGTISLQFAFVLLGRMMTLPAGTRDVKRRGSGVEKTRCQLGGIRVGGSLSGSDGSQSYYLCFSLLGNRVYVLGPTAATRDVFRLRRCVVIDGL